MRKHSNLRGINRIIDANINRAKEGLRVCEEVVRFILNSQALTLEFKKTRHAIDAIISGLNASGSLLKERESLKDVGKELYLNELERKNYQDIFSANIQRAKESVRVLEEFSKLKNPGTAVKLKRIRYGIYEIEKKAFERIASLRGHR